jgi:anti-sigma factor RsiW
MNVKWNLHRCRNHQENISLLVAGVLTGNEQSAAEEHLAGCAQCRQYFEEVTAVARSLAQLNESAREFAPSEKLHDRWSRQILRPAPKREPIQWPRKVWLELILPARGIWIGFACVWAMLLSLNYATSNEPQVMACSGNPEILAAVKEQTRMMAQLLETGENISLPPAVLLPRPRSERRVEQMIG